MNQADKKEARNKRDRERLRTRLGACKGMDGVCSLHKGHRGDHRPYPQPTPPGNVGVALKLEPNPEHFPPSESPAGRQHERIFREGMESGRAAERNMVRIGFDGQTPDHYKAILPVATRYPQPFDLIRALRLDFFAGNALKYLWRMGRKSLTKSERLADAKKARHYIDEVIADIEREDG